MNDIEKARLDLTQYDPFPLLPGQQRKVGNFVFEIKKHEYKVSHNPWSPVEKNGYVFDITNTQTKEERKIYVTNSSYCQKEIDALKLITQERKKLSLNKLLWGLNKNYADSKREGSIAKETRNFNTLHSLKRVCYKNYWNIPNHREKIDYKNLDLKDLFIRELKEVLEKDKTIWKTQRKNNPLPKDNTLADTIRTNELLKLLPLFKDLSVKLDHFNSSGLDYTMNELDELERSLFKIKNKSYLFVKLRKYCNKKSK